MKPKTAPLGRFAALVSRLAQGNNLEIYVHLHASHGKERSTTRIYLQANSKQARETRDYVSLNQSTNKQ
jgi:hypothetical protein